MSDILHDQIYETSTTAGAGTLELDGPVEGHEGFDSHGTVDKIRFGIEWNTGYDICDGFYSTDGSRRFLSRTFSHGNSAGVNPTPMTLPGTLMKVYSRLAAAKTPQTDRDVDMEASLNMQGRQLTFNTPRDTYLHSAGSDDLSIVLGGRDTVLIQGGADRFSLQSRDPGAVGFPELRLIRMSPTPASNDYCGYLRFMANDSGSPQNLASLARIRTQMISAVSGLVTGEMVLQCWLAGTELDVLRLAGDRAMFASGVHLYTGGRSAQSVGTDGHELRSNGQAFHIASGAEPLTLNRKSTDGIVLNVMRDGVAVGNLTVAGGVLSLTGAAIAHAGFWAAGQEPESVAVGMLLESVDEEAPLVGERGMPRVRLARQGSRRVYGTFQLAPERPGLGFVLHGASMSRVLAEGKVEGGDLMVAGPTQGVAVAAPVEGRGRYESSVFGKCHLGDGRSDRRLVTVSMISG